MFELELMTEVNLGLNAELCNPSELCGPDYGVDCMPDCDPADDW